MDLDGISLVLIAPSEYTECRSEANIKYLSFWLFIVVEDKRTTNCNSRNNWPFCYLLINFQMAGELPKSKVNKMIYSCWEHIWTLAEKHSYHIALNPSAIFSHNQSCFCNSENSFL